MKNIWQKTRIAFSIEYHWWRIRHLKKKSCRNARFEQMIRLHRYRAAQLSDLYEVLAGIRDFDHRIID